MNKVSRLLTTLMATLAALMAEPGAAQTTVGPFKSFEVQAQDVSSPVFVFSEAYATSDSPMVITTPGRKLTNKDREFRTDLQRHWLSLNVPKGAKFVLRTLDMCGRKVVGEYPFCDHYRFLDPVTNKRLDYFIYVGNWP